MRLAVLLSLLSLISPACAEWVKYGESDNAVYYYDPSTIAKSGNDSRVWQFQDLKTRATDGSRSIRFLSEYDCKGSRFQILQWSTYPQTMLRGKAVDSGGRLEKWVDIAPGTSHAALLKDVCQFESPSRGGGREGAGAKAARKNVAFVTQVGAYADPDKVEALTKRLGEAKMPYYTEPIATAKGPVTRVRVGPFPDRAAAEKALEALKKMGLNPGSVFARP
jgi:hypothetical protein